MKLTHITQSFTPFILFVFLSTMSAQAAFSASWNLDEPASSIHFFSVKKGSIGESHTFTDFSGEVSGNVATVVIKPDSVDSRVPIRNQRMREFLFKTKAYPTIEIRAQIDQGVVDMQDGVAAKSIPAALSMHGVTKEIELDVVISRSGEGVTVSSAAPVIIKASEYGMSAGVQKLGELVGGIDIASSVPVNFNLVFKAN